MDTIQPNSSDGSKMPKWAVALMIILALLFIMQSTVIFLHFAHRETPRQAETALTPAVPVVSPAALRRMPSAVQQIQQTPPQIPNPAGMFNDPFFDDAFSSMGRLTQHMSSLFDRLSNLPAMDTSFMPTMDIEETAAAYVVRADVPGLDKDKIDVTVRGNMLTIQGVRETGSETKDEKAGYYSQERSYGSFARSVMLPGPVDEANIKADYKNGVLTITLPKTQTEKEANKIPVQ